MRCHLADVLYGGYEMSATVQLYLERAKQGANKTKKHVARMSPIPLKHWLATTTLSPMFAQWRDRLRLLSEVAAPLSPVAYALGASPHAAGSICFPRSKNREPHRGVVPSNMRRIVIMVLLAAYGAHVRTVLSAQSSTDSDVPTLECR